MVRTVIVNTVLKLTWVLLTFADPSACHVSSRFIIAPALPHLVAADGARRAVVLRSPVSWPEVRHSSVLPGLGWKHTTTTAARRHPQQLPIIITEYAEARRGRHPHPV